MPAFVQKIIIITKIQNNGKYNKTKIEKYINGIFCIFKKILLKFTGQN